MSEPIYEGITTSDIKSESDYVGMNTGPNYDGVTADLKVELEPEYEVVTGYKRQDTESQSSVYVNTIAKPSHYINSS